MATLKEIKTRIQGVKSTQKITRAMKIVATTRLKKFENAMTSKIAFLDQLKSVYSELSKSTYDFTHPLMHINKANNKIGLVVISSDRGLCGAFNSQLFR
ncbi:F0F1 ATP synthase subunit gamma [Candidatus Omnitrophota bacterium]